MKVINLMGDGQDELFIQNTSNNVSIYDGNGAVILSLDYQYPKTTLGDVNGDGMEDIIVYYLGSLGYSVDVIVNGQVQVLAEGLDIGRPPACCTHPLRFRTSNRAGRFERRAPLPEPGRRAAMDIDSLGSKRGARHGRCSIGGQVHVAIATNDGNLAVYDGQGNRVWSHSQEQLRRLRAFDLNSDGNSEVITGGEYGAFFIYSAVDGIALFSDTLGQAVSEVREVELNGDPSSREIVAGGKDGGVWAFTHTGSKLWPHPCQIRSMRSPASTSMAMAKRRRSSARTAAKLPSSPKTDRAATWLPTRQALPASTWARLGNERYVIVADGKRSTG
jgi:hypothetical protein